MPLLKPTYQPFFPDPDSPAPKACNGTYCYPVASGDIIRQQWYQTPCSGSLVVDPEFEDVTLGAELVTNPGFTGSSAGWTMDLGWLYGSDAVTKIQAGVRGIEQTIVLTPGDEYQVEVVSTSGATATYLDVLLGSATALAQFTENGTNAVNIIAGSDNSDIRIEASNLYFGTISSVSVKAFAINSWVTNGVWFPSDGYMCKSAVGTGTLYNGSSDYITNGDYYVATVTVSGYGGDGTLTMFVDDGTGGAATNVQAAISANGTYTYYFTAAQDGVIGFSPSSAFTGCISEPTVRRLRNDYPFTLIDAAGDSIPLADFVTYFEDKVTLLFDPQSMELDYQCFTIEITDSCLVSGDDVVTDGDFANQNYTNWIRNAYTYQYELTGTAQRFVFDPLADGADLVSNGDFSSGATDWSLGTGWTISGGGALHTPGSTAALTQSITLAAIPALPQILRTWYEFTISGRTAGTVTVSLGAGTSTAFSTNGVITQTLNPAQAGATTLTFTPSSNFDGTIDNVVVKQTLLGWLEFPMLSNSVNTLISAGNYQIDFDIVSISGDPGTMGVYVGILGMPYVYNAFQGLTVGSHSVQIMNYVPGQQQVFIGGVFNVAGINYPGEVVVDNVVAYRIEPFEATYTSECFNYQNEHPGTTLVTGWSDQPAFGLEFEDTEFLLQMRVECRSLNPVINKEAIVAKYSTGDAALKYAHLEKQWQFVTGYISESALTTLSAMSSCDHFTIGDSGEAATEYTCEVEEFSPQWRAAGDYDLAPAVLNIRKKEGGMVFNRHT